MKADQRRKPGRSAVASRMRPLQFRAFPEGNLLEISDSGSARLPTEFLLGGQAPRDPSAQVARLAEQFIDQNVERLQSVGVEMRTHFDGSRVDFDCTSANRIGAVPLLSPSSGKFDFGLIVRPRFGWSGLGTVMNATGWRVVPSPLGGPLLPRSDRKIPPWLLSSIVLFRLKRLLDSLERKFDLVRESRSAPRGSVDWTVYANRQISRGLFLEVPCQFPNLCDDRRLRSRDPIRGRGASWQPRNPAFCRNICPQTDWALRGASRSTARRRGAAAKTSRDIRMDARNAQIRELFRRDRSD